MKNNIRHRSNRDETWRRKSAALRCRACSAGIFFLRAETGSGVCGSAQRHARKNGASSATSGARQTRGVRREMDAASIAPCLTRKQHARWHRVICKSGGWRSAARAIFLEHVARVRTSGMSSSKTSRGIEKRQRRRAACAAPPACPRLSQRAIAILLPRALAFSLPLWFSFAACFSVSHAQHAARSALSRFFFFFFWRRHQALLAAREKRRHQAARCISQCAYRASLKSSVAWRRMTRREQRAAEEAAA